MNERKIKNMVKKIKETGDLHREVKSFLKKFEGSLSDETYNELVDLHNCLIKGKVSLINSYQSQVLEFKSYQSQVLEFKRK